MENPIPTEITEMALQQGATHIRQPRAYVRRWVAYKYKESAGHHILLVQSITQSADSKIVASLWRRSATKYLPASAQPLPGEIQQLQDEIARLDQLQPQVPATKPRRPLWDEYEQRSAPSPAPATDFPSDEILAVLRRHFTGPQLVALAATIDRPNLERLAAALQAYIAPSPAAAEALQNRQPVSLGKLQAAGVKAITRPEWPEGKLIELPGNNMAIRKAPGKEPRRLFVSMLQPSGWVPLGADPICSSCKGKGGKLTDKSCQGCWERLYGP